MRGDNRKVHCHEKEIMRDFILPSENGLKRLRKSRRK